MAQKSPCSRICERLALLALLGVSACVPVLSTFYDPQNGGDVRVQGACSMNLTRTVLLHLESNVDVDIDAISRGPGHERAVVVIGFTVPAGTSVKLLDLVATLREGVSAPPVAMKIDRIRKPRTVVDGSVSNYLDAAETMVGPAGYGIEVALPRQNPPELSVTVPPLSINGQRVDLKPVNFILRTRPHLVGLCT